MPNKPHLDVTGYAFGHLTALERAGRNQWGKTLWRCECDCGNETIVPLNSLRAGHTETCGRCGDKGRAGIRKIIRDYKAHAVKRGFSWDLTLEDVKWLTSQDCSYCGGQPSMVHFPDTERTYIYNGIDRVDTTKGYSVDNCVACCKHCNRAKSDMGLEAFLKWATKLANHIHQTNLEYA